MAGSERYCLDLANRQAALGHKVSVAGANGSPLENALAPAICFRGFSPWFRTFQLRRWLAEIEPDICHAHLNPACRALGAIRGNHRSVATLHAGYQPRQHARLDGVICVNHQQAAHIDRFPGLVRTIANWQPTEPKLPPAGIREELGLPTDTILVGAVGRLHESKGHDVLIRAFRATAPANAALVIVGEGPQRKTLEKLREGDRRIHLIGHRPVVQSCLRDLDLFVSPSREESFGLAIVEAMSFGLPIVSTAAQGPLEFLYNQPVRLVPPGCVPSMTTALRTSFAWSRAGLLPRVVYDMQLFDPEERVGEVLAFYGQVAAAARRRLGQLARSVRPVAVAT